jgi:hypothetical protein
MKLGSPPPLPLPLPLPALPPIVTPGKAGGTGRGRDSRMIGRRQRVSRGAGSQGGRNRRPATGNRQPEMADLLRRVGPDHAIRALACCFLGVPSDSLAAPGSPRRRNRQPATGNAAHPASLTGNSARCESWVESSDPQRRRRRRRGRERGFRAFPWPRTTGGSVDLSLGHAPAELPVSRQSSVVSRQSSVVSRQSSVVSRQSSVVSRQSSVVSCQLSVVSRQSTVRSQESGVRILPTSD